jgi:hypothetical protein
MRVRLKTLMAGPEGVFTPGSVVNVSLEEAEALIAGGCVEPLNQLAEPLTVEPAAVETAAIEPGSRAVKVASRARKTQ